jgi:hypothetical protein
MMRLADRVSHGTGARSVSARGLTSLLGTALGLVHRLDGDPGELWRTVRQAARQILRPCCNLSRRPRRVALVPSAEEQHGRHTRNE